MTVIEWAETLGRVLVDHRAGMPKDYQVAVFVFQYDRVAEEVGIGCVAEVPSALLKEWIMLWLSHTQTETMH